MGGSGGRVGKREKRVAEGGIQVQSRCRKDVNGDREGVQGVGEQGVRDTDM